MVGYYTPSIEEFRVGFVYEIKEFINGIPSWKSNIIKNPREINQVDVWLKEVKMDGTQIRVKYLDKEDIESLGYKIIKEKFSFDTEYEKWYTFIIDNNEDTLGRKLYLSYHLGYFYNYETGEKIRRLTEISIKWKKENISSLEDINNIYNLFAGEIKNLSELKVLIKQLGIE